VSIKEVVRLVGKKRSNSEDGGKERTVKGERGEEDRSKVEFRN
jgi:hypothetical protein